MFGRVTFEKLLLNFPRTRTEGIFTLAKLQVTRNFYYCQHSRTCEAKVGLDQTLFTIICKAFPPVLFY